LVDPIWETIDPTPDIYALFQQYDDTFFSGRLAACEVKWSPRMTSSAGLCSFESRGKFCSIRLSKPLLQYRPRKDLVETLLHEMIHAFLFLDRDGHGPMFQFHMRRINMNAGTNITIYHSFHDEVIYHQKHWWRCTGPCRMRPPFHGWVKRSMNRAPGKNDFWWKEHQMTCGGNFIKVKEPEDYGTKKMSKILNGKSPQSQTWQTPLDQHFTGRGHVLGYSSSSSEGTSGYSPNIDRSRSSIGGSQMKLKTRSTENCSEDNLREQKITSIAKEDAVAVAMSKNGSGLVVKESIPECSKSASAGSVESANDEVIICVPCPVCNVYVPENIINFHLDSCLT
uniref:Protein with SprT-like domain at the N terminus n=1 Tax=Elaeophora elaphi TaxID=1147741 RepID=A0A0R3RU34_9BILA